MEVLVRIGRWLCIVLVMLLFSVDAEKAFAIACYDCHGSRNDQDYRPVDSPYRNFTTGGFKGNHRTHMDQAANASSCAKCHPSAGYGPGHRNSQIDITFNINSSPKRAVYRNGSTVFPQQAFPGFGSCSNVNCHFERETPAWGSAKFIAPGSCDKCHGAPPAGTSPSFIGGDAGSHDVHNRYYTGTLNCIKCHRDHTADSSPFAHATSILSRPIPIQPRTPLNNTPNGSYSGGEGGHLPSQASGHIFGNCSNTYCHSTVQADGGLGQPAYGAPVWGTPLPTCNTTCHDVGGHNGESAIATGSHTKHLAYSFGLISSASVGRCTICHHWPATPTNASNPCAGCHTPLSRLYTKHVNGMIDIAFNVAVTYGSYSGIDSPMSKLPQTGYKSCTNIYCHSSGVSLATGIVPNNPVRWGGAPLSCTSCHEYPPSYTNGQPKANSHIEHVEHGHVNCKECHFGTTSDGSTINSRKLHVNKAYSVTPATVRTFQYSFAASGGTCSNISCHFRGSATWGVPLGCDGCHEAPPDTPSHRVHFGGTPAQAAYGDVSIAGDYSPNATSYIMNCGNCHPMDPSKHRNDVIEVELYNVNAPAGSLKAMNPASAAYVNGTTLHTDSRTIPYTNGTCSNVYCHSYNSFTTPDACILTNISTESQSRECDSLAIANLTITRVYKEVTWNSKLPNDCSGCHGNAPQTTAATNDGGTGNSHSWIDPEGWEEGHFDKWAFRPEPITCNYCHNDTVKQISKYTRTYGDYTPSLEVPFFTIFSGVPIANYSKHVNGTRDVAFDTTRPFVYSYISWGGLQVFEKHLNTAQYDSATKTCSNVSCHNLQTSVKWGTPYRAYKSYDTNPVDYQCQQCHPMYSY